MTVTRTIDMATRLPMSPTDVTNLQTLYAVPVTDTVAAGAVAVDFAASLSHLIVLPAGATTLTFTGLKSGWTGLLRLTQPAGATAGTVVCAAAPISSLSAGNSKVDYVTITNMGDGYQVQVQGEVAAAALTELARQHTAGGRLWETIVAAADGVFAADAQYFQIPVATLNPADWKQIRITILNPSDTGGNRCTLTFTDAGVAFTQLGAMNYRENGGAGWDASITTQGGAGIFARVGGGDGNNRGTVEVVLTKITGNLWAYSAEAETDQTAVPNPVQCYSRSRGRIADWATALRVQSDVAASFRAGVASYKVEGQRA